jgi:hypothetical protein
MPMTFFVVFTLIVVVTILMFAGTIYSMFGSRGLFRSAMERAATMQREQREHELRLAELAGQRERPWTCTHCDSQNLAVEPECQGCGATREDPT